MIRTVMALGISLACLSSLAFPQTRCSDPALQNQTQDAVTIQRLEKAWSAAFLKGNVEVERCLLLPEFTEIFGDGRIEHLEDELNLARANQGKDLPIPAFRLANVLIHGNVAVAFGTSESKGTVNKRRWWYADYYVWEKDQWHVYFAQQTRFPITRKNL